ncbi:hypothetical protein WJX72_006735 [[Myrmecia] bisecta]|uniref:Uncharacterized protein n=1 Tax=[Myrmecia] bisecta TaxID=41462 RepID=A0AAW1QQZ7_9CHLO
MLSFGPCAVRQSCVTAVLCTLFLSAHSLCLSVAASHLHNTVGAQYQREVQPSPSHALLELAGELGFRGLQQATSATPRHHHHSHNPSAAQGLSQGTVRSVGVSYECDGGFFNQHYCHLVAFTAAIAVKADYLIVASGQQRQLDMTDAFQRVPFSDMWDPESVAVLMKGHNILLRWEPEAEDKADVLDMGRIRDKSLAGFDASTPVYVAGGAINQQDPLYSLFSQHFASKVYYRTMFLPEDQYPEVVGDKGAAVDFLVLVDSAHAVGVKLSTFSAYVKAYRKLTGRGSLSFIDPGDLMFKGKPDWGYLLTIMDMCVNL